MMVCVIAFRIDSRIYIELFHRIPIMIWNFRIGETLRTCTLKIRSTICEVLMNMLTDYGQRQSATTDLSMCFKNIQCNTNLSTVCI